MVVQPADLNKLPKGVHSRKPARSSQFRNLPGLAEPRADRDHWESIRPRVSRFMLLTPSVAGIVGAWRISDSP